MYWYSTNVISDAVPIRDDSFSSSQFLSFDCQMHSGNTVFPLKETRVHEKVNGFEQVCEPRLVQAFYEDVFEELARHGKVECLNICDNYSDHLVGNVYVKFAEEQAALNAMTGLQNRYYNGRPIIAEFSPVADFREATCRQYEENTCNRGGYCNFMHLKPISRSVLPFQPENRLGHPDQYLFLFSKKMFSGSKYPKNVLLFF